MENTYNAVTGRVLFRVLQAGHEYTIYDDGRIHGFGDGAIVFNHFRRLEREDYLRECLPLPDRLLGDLGDGTAVPENPAKWEPQSR